MAGNFHGPEPVPAATGSRLRTREAAPRAVVASWRLLVVDLAVCIVVAFFGGLAYFAIAATVDMSRWWFGV